MQTIFRKIQSFYYSQKIHTIVIIFSVFLFVVVTVPSYLFLKIYQQRLDQKQLLEIMDANLETSSGSFLQILMSAHRISTSIISSKEVQAFLSGQEHDALSVNSLEYAMKNLCSSTAYPLSVYLIDLNGSCYYSDFSGRKLLLPDLDNNVTIQEARQLDGKILCVNSDKLFTDADGISIIRLVNNLDTLQGMGYLILNIPLSAITDAIGSSGIDLFPYFLVDSQGNTVLSTQTSSEFYDIIRKTSGSGGNVTTARYIAGFRRFEDYGSYTFGYLYDKNNGIATNALFFNPYFIVILLNFLILWLGILLLLHSITKPIISIAETMVNFTENKFQKIAAPYTENTEIGTLIQCHNIMADKIQALLTKEISAEKHRRHLELSLLQAQFKPHFLYNTIDHARTLCLMNENKLADQLLLAMGIYYRTILSKGKTFIPIDDEVNTIIQYQKILENREESFYEIDYYIDDYVKDSYILKFILQPLVENCITHGLYGVENGKITITFQYQDKDILWISVTDNGRGIAPAAKTEIIRQSYHNPSKSFGLAATIERMRLCYGKDCSFEINDLSPGTEISIHIYNYSKYANIVEV